MVFRYVTGEGFLERYEGLVDGDRMMRLRVTMISFVSQYDQLATHHVYSSQAP